MIKVSFYLPSSPHGGTTGNITLVCKDEDQAAECMKIALLNNATTVTINKL